MIRFLQGIVLSMLPFGLWAQLPAIIPEPVQMDLKYGVFDPSGASIRYDATNVELRALGGVLNDYWKHVTGRKMPVNDRRTKSIEISLDRKERPGTEGYSLDISPKAIRISENSHAGVFYGLQTLFQMLPAIRTNGAIELPCLHVEDFPRFGWRGMHLDVSRHYFPPEFIKEYLDLMARYKMNVFHWHLADDQGWRLEIKRYPKLTEVGAWRVEHPGVPWDQIERGKPNERAAYGGWYTQQQAREIVAYAKARNIVVLPEIEMPGHSIAAIAAYPELSCQGKPVQVQTGGNYGYAPVYCPGKDSVFLFLQNVLDEVISVFPSEYIHVGGDEVDKTLWKSCPNCQARMQAEGLKNEEELQSYFIRRMEKYILSKKRKMVGWDEILEGGLAPQATVMSWRGEQGGVDAARQHHTVVMTPGFPCYFDTYQSDPETEPVAIGGFNTLKKVYAYEPIPDELTTAEQPYVLGAQGTLWTEFVSSTELAEFRILPRMVALSEVLWSPRKKRNWDDFRSRLDQHFQVFNQKGWHYCRGNFKLELRTGPGSGGDNLSVTLGSEVPGTQVHYTLDGSDPTSASTRYLGPVELSQSTTLIAISVYAEKNQSRKPQVFSFQVHKAAGKTVAYAQPYHRNYPGNGPNTLTDGIRGSQDFHENWHGFSGHDLDATIDLGKMTDVHRVTLGCLQHYGAWIFFPLQVKVETSADGVHFSEALTLTNTLPITDKGAEIHDFVSEFPMQKARFIRVTAKNRGVCPPGHPYAGKECWVFADELVVE
jgi:hexosaminidase